MGAVFSIVQEDFRITDKPRTKILELEGQALP